VNDALQHIGGVFFPVRNIPPAPEPWRYRNKTQYPVANQGGIKIGFFQRASHHLLSVSSCLLHPAEFDHLRAVALNGIIEAAESAFDEQQQRGNLRHLVFRRARESGQLLVLIVTRTESVSRGLVDKIAAAPGVVGVVHNVNNRPGNRILGPCFRPLVGQDHLVETTLDRQFRVSAGSFFQVNTLLAGELARKVLRHIAPNGNETVLDLFSGVGMLALLVAPFVRNVTGIEASATAVGDAQFNAAALGCTNADFICGDVETELARLTAADAVIVDPPRRGCTERTIRRICELRPKNVVYVSCNPATLARDLRVFESNGYMTRDVEPLDMFPQTFHVETVTHLARE